MLQIVALPNQKLWVALCHVGIAASTYALPEVVHTFAYRVGAEASNQALRGVPIPGPFVVGCVAVAPPAAATCWRRIRGVRGRDVAFLPGAHVPCAASWGQ